MLYLVQDIVRTRILHLYHNVGVKEVWCNHVWHKWSVLFLEHNGHNVISYMSLSLQLKHREGGTEIIMKTHYILYYPILPWSISVRFSTFFYPILKPIIFAFFKIQKYLLFKMYLDYLTSEQMLQTFFNSSRTKKSSQNICMKCGGWGVVVGGYNPDCKTLSCTTLTLIT